MYLENATCHLVSSGLGGCLVTPGRREGRSLSVSGLLFSFCIDFVATDFTRRNNYMNNNQERTYTPRDE